MSLARPTAGFQRTAVAALLTLIAVAVPSGAWFIAGSHKISREAVLMADSVHAYSYKKAVVMAERLATRLEVLREAESTRPFYHYQNLYHDPKGASEGASVSISPLAQGPSDPLVDAYFQVDGEGYLTLPTLNDEFPELGLISGDGDHCELLAELDEVASFCALEGIAAAAEDYDPRGDSASFSGVQARQVVLTRDAWRQHLAANALYAELKAGRKTAAHGWPSAEEERVTVSVAPLGWRTFPIGDGYGLVAVRDVDTPRGRWSQGFLVSHDAVDHYLKHSPYPMAFVPRTPRDEKKSKEGELRVGVEGTPWQLRVDIREALGETEEKMQAERRGFLRTFALGALLAGLAGLLVIGLVYQSERLAQQRVQFSASAAHELRTPLAGLRLYAEMLAEGLGDPNRGRQYARRVAGEAERLGRVVTNVLGFTHLERGSLSIVARLGDLGEAVRVAVERHQPALEEAGAPVELTVPDDLPHVEFDRDAVSHIVQNLLDNAEKYTRGAADRRVRVRLEEVDAAVVLAVEDSGPGVPEALQRKLFRPFSRGGEHDAVAGLGLGLVLVKELVTAQGGEIGYRDGEAGGAVFSVRFPLPTA